MRMKNVQTQWCNTTGQCNRFSLFWEEHVLPKTGKIFPFHDYVFANSSSVVLMRFRVARSR